MRTLSRIFIYYWPGFNTLNLAGSLFILERERERTYIASHARQYNHYSLNSKGLAFLNSTNLRRIYSCFFSINFYRLFNNILHSTYHSVKSLTLSSKNMLHSSKFFTSSPDNIPGFIFHKSFSRVSNLKFSAPLVKVGQNIPIQVCINYMYELVSDCRKNGNGDNRQI